MKHIALAFLLSSSLLSSNLFAQEEMQISKNAIELDLLNFDRLYNLNYSRAFIKNKWAIIPKVGIYVDLSPYKEYTTRDLTVPAPTVFYAKSRTALNAGVDFLYGKKKHFLRFGVNSMVAKEYLETADRTLDDVLNYAIEPSIGYRFQKKKQGFYFSASLRPLVVRIDAKRNGLDEQTRSYNLRFQPLSSLFIPRPGIGYSF